ncbi:hypothetical protein LEN26_015760 [Aphanomyces euteiches]|nr:hypothetical protein LEN26_015760 [Aphanomyces euteiches]KAH9126414.1 hypothetical protein AeMF1_003165 [Aphanomyces euteiches]KAH9190584.1 hypothetical protein AeNC1_007434 [Aphanomyces euteiches]
MSAAEEKSSSRIGSRRASKSAKEEKDDMELQMQDINSDEKGVPPKRTSGWGDVSQTPAADTSRSTNEESEPAETKRGRRRKEEKAEASKPKNKHFDDDGDTTELMEIPDLEEEEREPDITTQIADAPRNTARVVQSLKELERDVKYSLPATSGVDLQILTSFLIPQKAVLEEDEEWTFDSLLRDIFQELQKELDDKDNQDEGEGNPAAVKAP